MKHSSYQFSHAICRLPSQSLVDGLRAVDVGRPDYARFVQDHEDYMQALKKTGATVITLDPLEEFPDSVFIEDAALCLPRGCVIMRPGAPSRLGEAEKIISTLSKLYSNIKRIEAPGFIEGGDVLTTEKEILVGKSERTNSEGIDALRLIVKDWGYQVCEVDTPKDILHFKTDCSLLDENTILSTQRLAATGCFDAYEVIEIPKGEEACANTIRFNDVVIIPKGFPKTQAILQAKGYVVKTIGNTEAAKLDGGMSCLSLRFTPS